MKVWITKHCLTHGIEEIEAEISTTDNNMIVKVKDKKINDFQPDNYYHGQGKEWHNTKDSAIKRAEEMRCQKISSLKKQLAKLEALKFD